MSSSNDKFETLISFVSHIDDSKLNAEIQKLQHKIKTAENNIVLHGNTDELTNNLQKLEAQVDSLYNRFEKVIPLMQEMDALGINFGKIDLTRIDKDFKIIESRIQSTKAQLQDTYSKLQEFVGGRGEISAPDFSKSGLANIQAWKQQLLDLGATNVVFDNLAIKSATFEEALTGLGRRITTVSQTGVTETEKLSAAGEALAQAFHNMGDSAFAAFDKMGDPAKLKALSDKIQNIRMTAWNQSSEDKINREFFKMGIADGLQKEVSSADSALKEFMTKFRQSGNVTIEEAKRIAKELGGEFNIGAKFTDQAGTVHAQAQLITKDLQAISFSVRSYKEEMRDGKQYWGLSTGGTSTITDVSSQKLNEYQAGLQKSLQLRQQLSQAEQSGNEYLVNMLKQQKVAVDQNNASLQAQLSALNENGEAYQRYVAIEAQHRQNVAAYEGSMRWEQEKIAIDGVIQKYNELKQAELKVQQASLTNAPKVERQTAMAEQVKATTEFQKAQASLAPHLQNNQRLINSMADADAKATAATLKLTQASTAQGFSLRALGTQFKTLATNVLQYQLAWKGFQAIINTIKKVIETTKELDQAMTNIRIVTGQTKEEVHALMNSYAELGKSVGATATEVSEGAIGWLRQGRSLEETNKLIETSAKLSKLGMMESSEATNLLTAAINGFNISAQDSESVVDKLVKVDLNFATSTQELATALQYTAASAKLAGVSLDQMIGLIATVSATTRRSAESIGQSFKTMFSRLQRVSAGKQLDEYGESLNDVEKRLRTFGIELRNANNEWRNEWEVMSEIGERWKEFSNVEKSAIAEVMGGTRQRENLLVVFENWDKVLKATTLSMNSAGTAEEKYAAYMDSLQAKVNQFTATWQELVNNLGTGDTLKGFVDFGTRILELVDKFHLLQVAMYTALGAGGFKLFSKGIIALDTALNGVSRTVSSLYETLLPTFYKMGTLMAQGVTDTTEYATLMSRVTQQFQAFSPAMQARILNEMQLNQALRERIANELGLQVAEGGTIIATDLETAATQRLNLAMKNLGVNLKIVGKQMLAFFATNPLGWLIIAVGAAVAAVKIFDALTTTFEEQQEKIGELQQEYESLENELTSLQNEAQTTTKRIQELEKASREGKLTLVEAEELRNLRQTNIELKKELETRKAIVEAKKEQLSREVQKAYNPSLPNQLATVLSQGGKALFTGETLKTGEPLFDFKAQLYDLKENQDILKAWQKQLKEATDDKDIKNIQKQIDIYQKRVDKLMSSTGSFVTTMQDNMALLGNTPEEKALKQEMQDLIDMYLKIIAPQSYFATKLAELYTKLDDSGNKTKEYEDALKDLTDELLADKELWDTVKGSLGLTDEEIQSLETGKKGMEDYDAAYQKVVDKLDSEELKAEFNIDTSDLEDAEKAISKFASAIDTFLDTSKDLQEALEDLNDGNGLSLETISKLSKAYPELEEALSMYLAGLKTEADIQNLLKGKYNETTQAYKQSVIDKLSISEDFYNASVKGNTEFAATVLKLYGIEVSEYRTVEELKLAIARKTGSQQVTTAQTTKSNIAAAFAGLPASVAPAFAGMATSFGGYCGGMVNTAIATANAISSALGGVGVSTGSRTSKFGDFGAKISNAVKTRKTQMETQKLFDSLFDGLGDFGAADIGDIGGGGSPSGGGGGSGDDPWKAEFDALKAELDHRRKMEVISTKEYYDALNKLVEKYYKGNEKYLSEYKSEEEGLYDLKKELFEQDREYIDTEIEMLEDRVGQEDKILTLLEEKRESIHLQAEELRKMGVKDDTDAIRDLQSAYRSTTREISDVLNDILDEQENSLDHTKNLLELSGELNAQKELELAELHYRQIEEHYQKYKYIYDKDEKAFREYTEAKKDALDDLHDAATELIDSMLDELDDSLSKGEAILNLAGVNVFQTTRNIRDKLNELAQQGRITLQEFKDYTLDLIEREREAIDTAFEKIKNASIKKIEAQIKALQDEKDANNEYYDERIQRIRDVIDAMDKETEKENKLLDLEKKRLALEKARKQKNVQIYREGVGFVWEADPDEVKKATDDYNEAIRDYNNWQKKLDLQGQIDDFEKAKDANEKIIDEQIDNLNKLKEAWEESMDLDDVFDEYELSLMELMDDESLSFDQRMAKVKEFTEQYINKIHEIEDANYGLAQSYNNMMSETSGTGGKTWYATKEGKAPLGAREGDVILTAGGSYQIVAPNTAGASFSKESQLWSIKLDDVKTVITDDIAGTVKQTRSINTNTNALLNNTVTTNVLNQNVDELDNTTAVNSRQLSSNSTALHQNIEALEDVEQALQYFPENLQGVVATALSGLNLNGNGGAGGYGSGGYTGSWRKTTYNYELNGKTYTGVGYTQGMASFDEYQKAAGISGAKLISASTGSAETPPSGAIIEKTTTGLVKSSGGGKSGTIASLGNGQTVVVSQTKTVSLSDPHGSNSSSSSSSKGSSSSSSSSSVSSRGNLSAYRASKNASGTLSSTAGLSFVDELGEELIIRPPSQGRLTYLEKGAGVIPADITKNLWKIGQNPNDFFQKEFDKQVARYGGFGYDTSGAPISIVIGDIKLNGVQDVNSLSKAIVTKLPNQIIRDLYSKS